jgi:hypothetical protein
LAFQLNEATNTENSDDMAYWKHEIKALERMYVQAESAALAAPTPEAQPIPKLKPRRIKLVDDEGDPLPEATPTPDERADAGNDAERYRWLREQDDSGPLYTAPQAECAPRAKERLWLMVADNFTRAEFEQAFAECAPRMWIETGHFGSNEPSRLAPVPAPREAQPVVLVNRGALQAALNMLRRDAQEGRHARGELADEISASIAVPTPERAQPVGPRTTLNYDGTFDTTCAHCGGNGCFACLKSAAPTPERAEKSAKQQYDASGCAEEEPDPIERLRFFCSLAMNGQDWIDVEPFFDAITPERADAGKDAALYEAARLLASRLPTGLALASYFAAEELNALRAILAANKEPPERAEPRALPDWRIADGWHNTFSTSNPYCPCDLKSFTKAVRWAEHAIEQAVKERK